MYCLMSSVCGGLGYDYEYCLSGKISMWIWKAKNILIVIQFQPNPCVV